jgi:hypothetical protein
MIIAIKFGNIRRQKMKKLFCVLLVFTMAFSAFAEFNVKVTGNAPTVSGTGSDAYNAELQKAFDDAQKQYNDLFNETFPPGSKDPLQNLLQSMGNSSAYASHGATTRAYGGYKIFSATIGMMFGVQLPSGISTVFDDLGNIGDSIAEDHDVKLGASLNIFNAHVGLNMGIFGIDKLYLGLRVGYFNLPEMWGLSFNNFTLGVTANYQIIPSLSLAGLVTWRGVSLGTGVIYNNSKVNFPVSLGDTVKEDIAGGGNVSMDPEVMLLIDTGTVIIPLEAITSIKLVIFNIPFGIGADLAFGSASVGFRSNSKISLNDLPTQYTESKKGDISIEGSVSNSASIFNFKIMTGLGFAAGPVIFDFPVTIYPAGGYNFGFTIGAVF